MECAAGAAAVMSRPRESSARRSKRTSSTSCSAGKRCVPALSRTYSLHILHNLAHRERGSLFSICLPGMGATPKRSFSSLCRWISASVDSHIDWHKVQNMLRNGDGFVALIDNGYVRNGSRSHHTHPFHLVAHLDRVADEYGLQKAHAVVACRNRRGVGSRVVEMGQDFG